jgi:hypothetical protein
VTRRIRSLTVPRALALAGVDQAEPRARVLQALTSTSESG